MNYNFCSVFVPFWKARSSLLCLSSIIWHSIVKSPLGLLCKPCYWTSLFFAVALRCAQQNPSSSAGQIFAYLKWRSSSSLISAHFLQNPLMLESYLWNFQKSIWTNAQNLLWEFEGHTTWVKISCEVFSASVAFRCSRARLYMGI